jgi:hypothetical protein
VNAKIMAKFAVLCRNGAALLLTLSVQMQFSAHSM